MERLQIYLSKRGWNKKDINKTVKLIEKSKKNKHPKIKVLDKFVYWYSLLIAIIGNLFISISLVPVLIFLKNTQLYLVVITLGIAFGLLFELLIRDIENLEIKHHLFLGILIPTIATINFVIISHNMKKLIGIEIQQDPVIIGVIYSIAFILPYIIYQVFLKDKY